MPDPIPAAPGSTHPGSQRARLSVLLAAPRGFCAGVRRAIEAVDEALERFGPPVYVRRAIVHNLAVVRQLEARGAVFVEELDEVPRDAVVILSAHGVARSVAAEAQRRGLRAFDAVCPLVAKVHREVVKHHRAGRHVIMVGHAGHPEIVGSRGQVPQDGTSVVARAEDVDALPLAADARVAYAVQTTYSVDDARAIVRALTRRFPAIVGPPSSDICYATTNRQAAVKRMIPRVEAVIVAGEAFSSNASRLAEVAAAQGCRAVQLIADPSQIDWPALASCNALGITAAASTPEASIEAILAALGERFELVVEEFGDAEEGMVFKRMRMDAHAPAI